MPQFPTYKSPFGGAPAGAARDPSSGGYPSRSNAKGRPGQLPAPGGGMPPPPGYPSPIAQPGGTPPWGSPGGPGSLSPLPSPIQQMPYDPRDQPWGPEGPPPEPPAYERPTPPPGGWGPPVTIDDPIGQPGIIGAPDPNWTGGPGWPGGLRPPPPPGSRPGSEPIGGGLSDVSRRQLLMQLMQAARQRRAGMRPQQPNPYGPGYDYAGYPTPPPGMAGPV